MRNHYFFVLLLFLLVCCGDVVTEPPPNIVNISDVAVIKDIIQSGIKDTDIFQEETVPSIVDECPYNEACSIYSSDNSIAICNSGNLYNLPENIKSICTDICNISDDPTINKVKCAGLPTATCCTAIADKDSYFSSLSWCVPKELCCKGNEKLCGSACCHEDWYCDPEGQCLPQCNNDNDCQDDNICTEDKCVEGICQNFDFSASPESPYGCCFSDVRCQDNDFCTIGVCQNNWCIHCQDNDFCTIDVCQNNWCIHYDNPKCECQPLGGVFAECDDSNIQTADYCSAGNCVHANIPGVCESDLECDDGLEQTKIICTDNACSIDCIYDCIEKECGLGGCDESCGTCNLGTFCNGWQHCQCDPNYWCKEKECGSDNCGGICGVCPEGYKCNNNGKCDCIPKCDDKECGSDSCDGSCGICPIDYICDNSIGKCILQNPCKNLECGWIGEGENAKYCGDCPAGKICGINGKCKIPQLVCDDAPYENYVCQEKCDTENIQSSEPIQPSLNYGAYLHYGNNSWIEIKIPGIWPDADVLKIKFRGNKVCLKSVDSTSLECYEAEYSSLKKYACEGSTVVMNGALEEVIIDAAQTKFPLCYEGKNGKFSPDDFASPGHFPISGGKFEDGEVKLFFMVTDSFPICTASTFYPGAGWVDYACKCQECDCLSGQCAVSVFNEEKCENCLSFYCKKCPYLNYIEVISCRYE